MARVLAHVRREIHDAPARITPEVREYFARCRWPGNLRQLANVLRTAAIMAEGEDAIDLVHLPEDLAHDCTPIEHDTGADARDTVAVPPLPPCAPQESAHASRPARLSDWQTRLIDDALSRHDGNVSAAARELGLARNTVYRHLRRR